MIVFKINGLIKENKKKIHRLKIQINLSNLIICQLFKSVAIKMKYKKLTIG